ncbi:hypothetical protein DSM100688_0606 [Bifidobacterium ramosum]|uniref:Glycosyltransferase RgtA/B/C/D-like domain-containing protein n=1 Tax=Bifidobacterium ramosum TaxID=1798158 RepID=A0A6L4X1W2_9BIFI|nr:DUF6020 family protein [Bifidobacterium ramosum]KAB8288604.1 hypothetical protein DSM100688_0606 [Bifidobacterium ramosum]NEG71807.1 hypothetical protein [Bifidobacterium ramosum]
MAGIAGITLRPPTPVQTVLCAAGALTIAVADRAAVYGRIGPMNGELWLRACKLFVLLMMLCLLGEMLITRQTVLSVGALDGIARREPRDRKIVPAGVAAVVRWWRHSPAVLHVATLTILMTLCWLPYMLWLFPGMIWYDTGDQIAQFYGHAAMGQPAGVVSSHHPVFDTMVFGWAAKVGELWFGGYQSGLTVLILAQAVLMCVVLSSAVVYVRRAGAPTGTAIAVFLFFALFPGLPMFFMSLVKDSVHAVVFMPWLLMYIEACRSRLSVLRSVPFAAGFIVFGVLSSLTTATGFYITALSMLGLLLVGLCSRRGGMAGLRCFAGGAAVIVIVIVQLLFPMAARTVLNVHKEDPNQILVVPMQMTARYVVDHADDVTAEERGVIDALNNVPVERMPEVYNPFIADNVLHLSLKDPSYIRQYIQVWFAQGARHPQSYVNGFVALESGWFSLWRTSSYDMAPTSLQRLDELAPGAIPNQILMLGENAISPSFAEVMKYRANLDGQRVVNRLWHVVSTIPVLRLLTYTAVWSFVLPLFLLFCALRSRRSGNFGPMLMAAAPLIWSLLSLLPNAISIPLKPTASRYILWALYVVPVYVALLRADSIAGSGLRDAR